LEELQQQQQQQQQQHAPAGGVEADSCYMPGHGVFTLTAARHQLL
jgi:hypothetical protein